jgi:hypothetical protein
VVEAIVEEILKAKQKAAPEHRGVVFAWWGTAAKSLRSAVERMQKKYPAVQVPLHVALVSPATPPNTPAGQSTHTPAPDKLY